MFIVGVLVFLTTLVGHEAAILRSGIVKSCPPYVTKPDFDYRQYGGTWYEIKRIANTFQDGMVCVRAIYEEIGPNTISVLNTAVTEDGNVTSITGTGVQPRPDTEPGHLIVSFPGRPDGTYEILDTDYVNWTAVYSCASIGAFNFEFGWLMSRTNTLSPELLAQAEDAFARNGVSMDSFKPTFQSDDCNYVP